MYMHVWGYGTCEFALQKVAHTLLSLVICFFQSTLFPGDLYCTPFFIAAVATPWCSEHTGVAGALLPVVSRCLLPALSCLQSWPIPSALRLPRPMHCAHDAQEDSLSLLRHLLSRGTSSPLTGLNPPFPGSSSTSAPGAKALINNTGPQLHLRTAYCRSSGVRPRSLHFNTHIR